jgi:CRISPR-associated Csx11 family protein
MTHFQPAETLRKHRPLLLAMEAIGWLHMAGKAKADFLRQQGGQPNNYRYERWFESENAPFPWSDLLQWVKHKFPLDGNAWPSALTDFVTKHTERNPGLLSLLQAGHGMASGIEKNLPAATSGYLGQDVTHTWLSSAFGYPIRNLLAEPPEVLTDKGSKRLLDNIRGVLQELKGLGEAGAQDVETWRDWRELAIGPDSFLRQAFISTVAETRLPNNDVTLWDQSYVAAALFKSAVASALIEGQGFPWTDNTIKQKTRWRLLTFGIGADHYETRAVRIGDWKGSQRAIEDFFVHVQRLVEVDLAVGSLLYKDTEVVAFSFPGERDGTSTDLQIQGWENHIQERLDTIACELKLETPPYCHISKPSRSLILLAQEARKARETMAVPIHRSWEIPLKKDHAPKEGHVCPVCLVRLNGDPKEKQKPCPVCNDRRRGRLDDWLEERTGNETIWIDEVADANDRAALLTFSLDVEPWLEGSRLDSLRAQSIVEWRRHNPILTEYWQRDVQRRKEIDNPLHPYQEHEEAVRYVAAALLKAKGKHYRIETGDLVLANLQEGYRHESDWPALFAKIVEDRAGAKAWDELDDNGRARWLVHQLFRKLASPGRVFRFWRQAEGFFQACLHEFRGICSRDPNRWRVRRLIVTPDQQTSSGWQDRQTYSGRWRDAPLELLFRGDSEDFLAICNLARLLRPEDTKEALKGQDLKLRDDSGKERPLKIKDVRDDVGLLGIYQPIIPLELSPLRFRVLVPLEGATECTNRLIEIWEQDFGRVWDRLAIRAGVVAFTRMMSFQAVIEAARNLEDELREKSEKEENWRVAEAAIREDVTALHLVRYDGEQECRLVPVRLPDGREDVFYSYLAVEDMHLRFPRDFQHPDGRVYRHITELQPGDGVVVHPSTVATLFLEASAARFDRIEAWYLREWKAMGQVWDLVQRAGPSQTALRGLWSELEARREAWRNPDGTWREDGKQAWLDLVRAMLNDRLAVKGAALDALVDAARIGLLRWTLEWHLRVLKEQVGGAIYE